MHITPLALKRIYLAILHKRLTNSTTSSLARSGVVTHVKLVKHVKLVPTKAEGAIAITETITLDNAG